MKYLVSCVRYVVNPKFMKKAALILLCCFFANMISAQKSKKNTYIGFQAGVMAPFTYNNYSISKYKIGLPSFSYTASIENRFTINYKLHFSLQYSLSFFSHMQKKLEDNIIKNESQSKPENTPKSEFNSGINLNTMYNIKNNVNVYGGIGVTKPINLMDKNIGKNKEVCRAPSTNCNSNKFIPVLNPFFVIGIENSCNIFRRNLIYSIQYNIGFMPYRNLPLQKNAPQAEKQYMQGVNIGVKYQY